MCVQPAPHGHAADAHLTLRSCSRWTSVADADVDSRRDGSSCTADTVLASIIALCAAVEPVDSVSAESPSQPRLHEALRGRALAGTSAAAAAADVDSASPANSCSRALAIDADTVPRVSATVAPPMRTRRRRSMSPDATKAGPTARQVPNSAPLSPPLHAVL
jgi:hypothetical protein